MRSMRVQIFAFLGVLLAVMLLLVNIYPIITARDTAFHEKENAMGGQASTLAAALAKLDRPDSESVAEVLRLLDIRGLARITVADAEGNVLYDSVSGAGRKTDNDDLITAAAGKNVFRASFRDESFFASCAVPFSRQGRISGAVCLQERDDERAQIIIDLQMQLRVISVIIVVLAVIISAVYFSFLLSRIRALAGSMRVVAGGDYKHRLEVTGRDEIAELGKEFNMLTERLDDTERQRRRFVSDASHELKTPLASIRLLSDSIVQSGNMDTDTMREFVTDIGHEAERLQRTTEKLLDLSRLDDDISVMPEPVDVKQVAVDAIVLLRPLADERHVRIRCELADGCVVMATVDDMFHIIFNLTENAIKYNVPDGSVTLKLKATDDAVILRVEDTGIGIPETETYNIFTRFYRIDKARSRETGGSGLGLAIVHDTVKLHGGSISVGPNKPRGSVFSVSFPRPSFEETGI